MLSFVSSGYIFPLTLVTVSFERHGTMFFIKRLYFNIKTQVIKTKFLMCLTNINYKIYLW